MYAHLRTKSTCAVWPAKQLWAIVWQGFVQFVDNNYKSTEWSAFSQLCNKLCAFVIHASAFYEMTSEMAAKQAQALSLEKALKATRAELEVVGEQEERRGAASATAINAVTKAALEQGVIVHSKQAEWALLRCNGDETVATRMAVVQGSARQALAALSQPGEWFGVELSLQAVSSQQVRTVRAALKDEAIRPVVEAVEAQLAGGGASEEGKGRGSEGSDASGLYISKVEASLLSWALSICEWHEAKKLTEPQQQKLILAERKVGQKMRELEKVLHHSRAEVLLQAKKAEIPPDLFPAEGPWLHFPWEDHCRPRTAAEEKLRGAIGLREASQLRELIFEAAKTGLNKRNSRVYFEAVELSGLLQVRLRRIAQRTGRGIRVSVLSCAIRIWANVVKNGRSRDSKTTIFSFLPACSSAVKERIW